MFADQPDLDRQVAELVRIAESSLFRTREERADVHLP
jgi:hypothetical protein